MSKNILDDLTNAYLFYKFLPLIIILGILFVIVYFKFAVPVFKEDETLGYNQYETVYIDQNTGEKIPKNKLKEYNIIP